MNTLSMTYLFKIIMLCLVSSEAARSLIKRPKVVDLKGCECQGLVCNCCATIEIANNPRRQVCAKFSLIPNEVTFRGSLSTDGNILFTGQLGDPSIAPICAPPIAGLCLAVNHVDLQRRQVCTKLYAIFLTLVKFPCVGAENGKLVVEPNSYT